MRGKSAELTSDPRAVFSSRFSLGALRLPSSPTGTPSSFSANVSSHELEDQLSPLPLPIRTTSLGVDSESATTRNVPARLRLSQQRFNAPISPPYPSLYYQFPPHDPSCTLAAETGQETRPSSPRLRRAKPPPSRSAPPPLGSLPPKAAALLGLLPPLELPSSSQPPTPSSGFTALLPSSPLLRRTAYSPSPSPSYIEYHAPPRPSFVFTDRRGSADSTAAISLAAPSTRSATASTVKSFWSACVPGGAGGGGHSPSNSSAPTSAGGPSVLEIKIPASPSAHHLHSSSSPKTFGARRRHALEQRHGLGSTSLPDLSLEALGAYSPSSPSSPNSNAREPLAVNFRPPLWGSSSASYTATTSNAGKAPGLAAALGRKFSARRGLGRGRGRAQTALAAPIADAGGRGTSVDHSRVVVATEASGGSMWRAPSDEEVMEDDVEVRVRCSREGRRKTREAWEMESEVLRMRIRENLGY